MLLVPDPPSTEEDVVGLVWTATDRVIDHGLLEWQSRFLTAVSSLISLIDTTALFFKLVLFLCYLQYPQWYHIPGAAPLAANHVDVRGREWWLYVETHWDAVY
jgi:hypothetical protein